MENVMDDYLQASKDRHYTALRALGKAILLTEEMLRKGNTSPIPFKPTRALLKSELETLKKAHEQMRSAQEQLEEDPLNSFVPIELICPDETMAKYLAARNIVSVLDAWNYEPSPWYGIVDQCEALGAKGYQHLYFLAQY